MHHDHVVAEGRGQVEVVQDRDDRQPQAADPLQEVQLVAEVEVVGGLVQQQDLGLLRQRPRQVDALPLAAGEALPAPGGQLRHGRHLHGLVDRVPAAVPGPGPRPDVGNPSQRHHLADGKVQVGARVLFHQGDPPGP